MLTFIWRTALVFFIAVLSFGTVTAGDDREEMPSCKYCGMDRAKFAHSRMYITYSDGSSTGTCSLHCAALDLAVNIGSSPTAIKVSDYETRQLVNAEEAIWVIGGNQKGVMTRNAKWAFAAREDAEKFITGHGGSQATFEEAVQKTYEEMYEDTKMIRTMRQEKMMKKKKDGH